MKHEFSCYINNFSWLCWQSAANASLLRISLICGKIQGVSALRPLLCPADIEVSVLHQQEIAKFPKQRIREYFKQNREFRSGNRDISGKSRQMVQRTLRRSA